MSLRKAVLGLFGVLTLTGATAAEPPVNPLVEGREPDPVAREFNLPEQSVGGYVSGPVVTNHSTPGGWVAIAVAVMDVLFDQMTFPLGTAVVKDEPVGA